MNKAEALKILELDEGASGKDIKISFRKLAFTHHPDRNNEAGAEDKYKEISSAYEYLKNPPPERPAQRASGGMWASMRDFFTHTTIPQPPNATIKISFKESILGCKKKITINRGVKCDTCDGDGMKISNVECIKCSGKGRIHLGNAQMQFVTMCPDCHGCGKESDNCKDCTGKGYKEKPSDLDVKLQGGLRSGNVVRLVGGGHYYKNMGHDTVGLAYIIVNVDSKKNMRLVDKNVISTIEITLLEALKGATKKVKTILGTNTLKIKPGAKHKDQLKISGHGVERKGDHLFNLEVKYPKNTDGLIELLEDKK